MIYSYPLAFNAPVRGGFHRNITIPFGTEKLEWLKYFDDMFSDFDM